MNIQKQRVYNQAEARIKEILSDFNYSNEVDCANLVECLYLLHPDLEMPENSTILGRARESIKQELQDWIYYHL